MNVPIWRLCAVSIGCVVGSKPSTTQLGVIIICNTPRSGLKDHLWNWCPEVYRNQNSLLMVIVLLDFLLTPKIITVIIA
jgi:hypothetical protein